MHRDFADFTVIFLEPYL